MAESRKKLFACIVVVLLLLIPLSATFEDYAAAMDEGSLLVYPELILKGQLPYRDFETFYGPANPVVLAAAYAVCGPNLFIERAVGLIYRICILVAFFVLFQRWGTTIATGCLLIAGFLIVPGRNGVCTFIALPARESRLHTELFLGRASRRHRGVVSRGSRARPVYWCFAAVFPHEPDSPLDLHRWSRAGIGTICVVSDCGQPGTTSQQSIPFSGRVFWSGQAVAGFLG